jgi:hypothetical protein
VYRDSLATGFAIRRAPAGVELAAPTGQG